MYEAGTGMPVIATGGTDSGFGGGNLGSLLIGALLFGGGFGGFGGNRGLAGADLAATQGLQNQLNALSGQVTAQGIGSELNEIESSIDSANVANLQGIAQNALTYAQGNAAIQAALAGNNFTTLSSINGLGRDVITASNQNALQQLNSFNVLNTSMLQGFNEIGRDSAAGFNQLLMGQNTLGNRMAECCCDIKSAIFTDGAATRALINDLNTHNLEAQLADAKSALNAQSIINALRPTVIA